MPAGRTPLFRKLTQIVRQAHLLNQHPQHHALFLEARDAARVSRRDFLRLVSAAGLATAAGGFVPSSIHAAVHPTPESTGGDRVAI
ncbi:MAG: twin-arginine translocation signal domain-containing protein, partial [Chthoniobacterales bacterium]